MELEILQKEHAVQESSKDSKEDRNNPWITASVKEDSRLQEIKDRIRLYVLISAIVWDKKFVENRKNCNVLYPQTT
uniref:Uncharacterized protein n=1 Tax=Salix viminalis TaxID=40686 RepID=A0A6N2ML10_SALVM